MARRDDQLKYDEKLGSFSPDGRWIADQSDDSGAQQVVAQPFPPTGATVRVSTTTGYAPRWLASGDIVYAAADQHFMAVAVSTSGGVLRAGAPRELFARRFTGADGNRFNVDSAGQRFLLPHPATGTRRPADHGDRPLDLAAAAQVVTAAQSPPSQDSRRRVGAPAGEAMPGPPAHAGDSRMGGPAFRPRIVQLMQR